MFRLPTAEPWISLSRALFWALLAQIVFWGLLFAFARHPLPSEVTKAYKVQDVYMRPIEGLTPVNFPLEAMTRLEDGRSPMADDFANVCVRGSHFPAVQFSFLITPRPGRGYEALYLPMIKDNYALYINGRLLTTPRGKLGFPSTHDGLRAQLYGFAPDQLAPGGNRVDIVAVSNGCHPQMKGALFGPETDLRRLIDHRLTTAIGMPLITVIAASLLSMIAAALLPISGYNRLFLSVSLFMAALALRGASFMWQGDALEDSLRDTLMSVVSGLTLGATAYLLKNWTLASDRHTPIIVGVTIADIVLLLMGWLFKQSWLPTLTETTLIFVCAGYFLYRMWVLVRVQPQLLIRSFPFLSVGLVTTFYDLYHGLLGLPRPLTAGLYFPFVIIAGVGVDLVRRGFELFRTAEEQRADLERQVQDREADIRASYAKLQEQEQLNAVNAERQRLIRDMHDGVGGHLVSLLMQLKLGAVPPETMRVNIQSAVDDLRLIIDSMDSMGDSLEVGLAIFRERMRPRLQTVGVELTWRNAVDEEPRGYRPNEILNIYRILQEGVTNALKHAQPKTIDLSLRPDPDAPGWLILTLSDDGVGFPADERTSAGRGLSHLRRRAQMIGGRIDIVSALGNGTTIRLYVPPPATATA
ncbi:sensor histidine kinase [Asticcacaulis sp. AND118]|uniref:sensor histidine kinase n=1 Tax=Asticcacaulis sp. AND118 TaxID=2840468 RepID=UPI001CFF57CE|nr:ATP-binding protein [Asticcacaulis sp. AND118]UDF04584.1 histidine kinase [Asticcacaulis sp. AND118]